jgi:nitrogen fixation protein NifB
MLLREESLMEIPTIDIAPKSTLPEAIQQHPCYSSDAHSRYGRIHVPVAPRCNIQCNYCTRKFACPNENRPGVSTQVVSPSEALNTIGEALEREPRLKVLGVAGPGDALANEATLETFRQAKTAFPALSRCISTNGLVLPDKIDEVYDAGITSLTITINAVDPDVGEQVYSHVRYHGKTYKGREAFEVLSENQLTGLRAAAERGMFVKINAVMIPGVNDRHMVEIARTVKDLGAYTMNIIPMIPLAKFAHLSEPTDAEVNAVRDECETVIQQFRNCMRCRADAIGIPGEEGCGGDISTKSKTCSPRFLKDKAVMRPDATTDKADLA